MISTMLTNNGKLFHITRKIYIEDIFNEGIKPSSKRGLVYLTNDYEYIIENDSDFWYEDLVLLEVNITNKYLNLLQPDPEYDIVIDTDGSEEPLRAFTCPIKIEKEDIKYIGRLKLKNEIYGKSVKLIKEIM